MKKVSLEMSMVSQCDVTECRYNTDKKCNAKAITIGDFSNPRCDTFFDTGARTKKANYKTGVGACKVQECQYNQNAECTSDKIAVGFKDKEVKCLTFSV